MHIEAATISYHLTVHSDVFTEIASTVADGDITIITIIVQI